MKKLSFFLTAVSMLWILSGCGGIEQPITVEGEGRLRFDAGDIAYCPANNTAAIFYVRSSRPDLTMTVYPIGKVTIRLVHLP